MRIYNSTFAPINFGYNKELNDKVNNKLSKDTNDRGYAKSLMELNQTVNTAEDRLREAVKTNDKTLISVYTEFLINIKPFVADKIDERFPKLNYKNKEIQSYKREMSQKRNVKNNPWISKLIKAIKEGNRANSDVQALYEHADMLEKQVIKLRNEKQQLEKIKTPKPVAVQQVQQNANTKSEDDPSKLVEKYDSSKNPRTFDSLGGLEKVKAYLTDAIIEPLRNPEQARLDEIEYGKKFPRGVLLYGPPGCGKTSVMEAIACETGLPLYKLKVSKSNSKFVNQSSINVQAGYEYVAGIADKSGKPVLLGIDEMEAMTHDRNEGDHREDEKLVSTLLQVIEDAPKHNVIIIGATNYINKVDEAVKSRFNYSQYIGLPDENTRKPVIKICLNAIPKGRKLADDDEELDKVVKLTQGFANRDILFLTDKASDIARLDGRRDIQADDYIVPVRENQDKKVDEYKYKDKKNNHRKIGFLAYQ